MALTRSKGKEVCKYECLKAMNTNTAKFASWIVQIRKPEAKPVIFMDKTGKEQKGSRFQYVLTSGNETQYCLGVVPFQWKTERAARGSASIHGRINLANLHARL